MPRKSLEHTLSELEDELSRAGNLSGEERLRVEAALGRVRMVLEDAPTEELPERTRTLLERFEQDHPALTSWIGRIAESLTVSGF